MSYEDPLSYGYENSNFTLYTIN